MEGHDGRRHGHLRFPRTRVSHARGRSSAIGKLIVLLYSGHDPSRLFHRSVNKRVVPDYYDIIKEPMALSILKQRINKREYKHFSEFVRDCALVRDFATFLVFAKLTVPASRSPIMRRPTIDQNPKPTRTRLSLRYVDS